MNLPVKPLIFALAMGACLGGVGSYQFFSVAYKVKTGWHLKLCVTRGPYHTFETTDTPCIVLRLLGELRLCFMCRQATAALVQALKRPLSTALAPSD